MRNRPTLDDLMRSTGFMLLLTGVWLALSLWQGA